MNRKIMAALSGILVISMGFNIFLFGRLAQVSDQITSNSKRLKYLENNIENTIIEKIKEDGLVDSLLADVNWSVSELINEHSKTALLHVDFKLRVMDSTSRMYASIQEGGAEAVLVEVHQLNDTTYTVDREISVLKPVRIDLVVEKYGEKRLENLVDEEEIFRKYIADTAFNLLNFDYAYDLETGMLYAEYGAEVTLSSLKELSFAVSEIVVEKNGIVILRDTMEESEEHLPDTIVLKGKAAHSDIRAKELDQLEFAAVLKDKRGFNYRYSFAAFGIIDGNPTMSTIALPELTLR